MKSVNMPKPVAPLQCGETPMQGAPAVTLGNGERCIPQHYLLYRHTRASVEEIILGIEYCDRYLVFASEDDGGIYIQIGIVGYDNYQALGTQNEQKVVYGRQWRVEPHLPTSEIIQTIFLAIKKAREHEVRELFRFYHGGLSTTPFNNHHDLPLMAQNSALLRSNCLNGEIPATRQNIKSALELVTYDSARLKLITLEQLPSKTWILEIECPPAQHSQLPEIIQKPLILLLLKSLTINELYFQLMDAFLALSDRHVDENFYYQGFARFSRKNSAMHIAALSSTMRSRSHAGDHHGFAQTLTNANYETDKTRVPKLYNGLLTDKITATLKRFGKLNGILPS